MRDVGLRMELCAIVDANLNLARSQCLHDCRYTIKKGVLNFVAFYALIEPINCSFADSGKK